MGLRAPRIGPIGDPHLGPEREEIPDDVLSPATTSDRTDPRCWCPPGVALHARMTLRHAEDDGRLHDVMTHSLSEQQRAAFRREGYVAPVSEMTPRDAASYRTRVEEFIAGAPDHARLRTKVHLDCPALMELVQRPEILDAVSDVLGPDVLCRSSSLFIKDPHDDAFVAWHQDAAYWELDPPAVATAWFALTSSTAANGALRVLAGSHVRPLMSHELTHEPGNLLTRGQAIVDAIDEARAVTVELAPGQMSLHDVRLAHSSAPNRSRSRRIGYAIRYVAPHVRNTGARRDSAILVRGVDHYGHFDAEGVATDERA
jgi:ectoine hydroxylase-related dioxygenase (phytanoyl-CoA dioxygenase family)